MGGKIRFLKIPAVAASVMLLLSFFNWPYGYYTSLRIVVTGAAVYYVYYLYTTARAQDFWFWALVSIAILFNPIIPIYLYNKNIWGVIDVIVAIFFIGLIVKHKSK